MLMIENYQEFKNFLNIQNKEKKLLLHACCAPCASYTLELLNSHFNITIFFYNPNIMPDSEFEFRYQELLRLIELMKLDITVIKGDLDTSFTELSKGLEMEKEGGKRCYSCYYSRLAATAKFAKENDFDFFTTTLSISPYKNSKWINEIGYRLEKEYQINFLYSDFKKEEGYKKSIELSKKYNLYRQNYCGCVFSKRGLKND